MSEIVLGFLLLISIGLIVAGVAMVYIPAGYVTAGWFGMMLVVFYARGGEPQ